MKIANKILHLLLLIAALVIQITFFEQLKLFHISFDLVMVILIAITLTDGAFYGIILGFVIGLLLDLITGDIVGISALVYSLDAFLVWRLIESGFKYRFTSQLFMIFIVTETNLIALSIIRYLFNFQISLRVLGTELLLAPVFNIILLAIFYPVIKIGLNRGMESFEFKYKNKI
jgi:rod shape-determining protein MreD